MSEKKESETKEVSVIIVSYNTADLIGPCLLSLLTGQDTPMEIFVVDNASSDSSVDLIRREFPSVYLEANRKNIGYGAANNQVLSRCNGRYILLLNPDTIVNSGSIQIMTAYMDTHPHVGLAGPNILNPNGTLQDSVSYRYPGQRHTSDELSGLKGKIACVMGACQIVRTELMKEVGGFDKDFFLYGEDQDLCLRIRKLGYEIGYIQSAKVIHYGGKSERRATPSEVLRKKVKAEYLFYEKHYHPQTIRGIMKSHLTKAKWRIAILNLFLPFSRNRAAAIEKMQKYLTLKEVVLQQRMKHG